LLSLSPLRLSLANLLMAAAVWAKLKLPPHSAKTPSKATVLGELLICFVISCLQLLPACKGAFHSAVLLQGCLPILAAAIELALLVLSWLVMDRCLVAGADAACSTALKPKFGPSCSCAEVGIPNVQALQAPCGHEEISGSIVRMSGHHQARKTAPH
jgi:hypothetical protein